jgi:hypothetical protein
MYSIANGAYLLLTFDCQGAQVGTFATRRLGSVSPVKSTPDDEHPVVIDTLIRRR